MCLSRKWSVTFLFPIAESTSANKQRLVSRRFRLITMNKLLAWWCWTTLFYAHFCSAHDREGVLANDDIQLIEVHKIWDAAAHNAFTDLIRFDDQWICVFREGASHVSPDGALRIIGSSDGRSWESLALIESTSSDLRDAKITVTPNGDLMLSGAEALHDRTHKTHQSLVWFSADGKSWSSRHEIGDPNVWLWRTTWHGNTAYNIGYSCSEDRFIRLYTSIDGKEFKTSVERLLEDGYPNETSLVFRDDEAFCLLRRDGQPSSGMLGQATAPFTDWQWQELGVKIGGPCMIQIPDGRLLATVRLYHPTVRTSVCVIDPNEGTLEECLQLPSGGDTSYAGMVWHEGHLWISYYSSHEGKSSIYFAQVSIDKQE